MKFIGNLCLYLIWFVSIWVVGMLFASNASIYTWIVVIGLAIVSAVISNKYHGKHDE